MAKQNLKEKAAKKKGKRETILSLDAINYQIMLAGFAVIILGYVALSASPWDGVLPLDVAPILLVIGYCVILPIGIVYRKKKKVPEQPVQETETAPQN